MPSKSDETPVDAPRDAPTPKLPPELAESADFSEKDVHARAREAVRRMARRNLERAGRKP